MIYATGDTHGRFWRLDAELFPEQRDMTRDDYLIICGDFGGVWHDSPEEQDKLDRLEALPFTTLFVDGNHENFDRLNAMPEEEWHNGRVHRVRPHVLHLMRGQIFDLQGRTFFTMGGAASHDIQDGVLDPEAPDFDQTYERMWNTGRRFRVKGYSWWPEELPGAAEFAEAEKNLARADWKVDCIITHCAPTGLHLLLGRSLVPDALTDFLQTVKHRCSFDRWLFGHYHDDKVLDRQFSLLYERIVPVL